MKIKAISFQSLTLLLAIFIIFESCQHKEVSAPETLIDGGQKITGKLLQSETATPSKVNESNVKYKLTFVSEEMNISFDYPNSWTHISNWQGERGEIFVKNSDVDLFNDPRKNNTYLFIDNLNDYKIVGWKEIERKEMENKYGIKFNLIYNSPDEEYYIEKGITYLIPPVTETLIIVEGDVIPATMHFKYDSETNEVGEVNLMEILNTVSRINN